MELSPPQAVMSSLSTTMIRRLSWVSFILAIPHLRHGEHYSSVLEIHWHWPLCHESSPDREDQACDCLLVWVSIPWKLQWMLELTESLISQAIFT
jgi:hypothetical protein